MSKVYTKADVDKLSENIELLNESPHGLRVAELLRMMYAIYKLLEDGEMSKQQADEDLAKHSKELTKLLKMSPSERRKYGRPNYSCSLMFRAKKSKKSAKKSKKSVKKSKKLVKKSKKSVKK